MITGQVRGGTARERVVEELDRTTGELDAALAALEAELEASETLPGGGTDG